MGNPKEHYYIMNAKAGLIAACKAPTERIVTAPSSVTCLTCLTMIRLGTVPVQAAARAKQQPKM